MIWMYILSTLISVGALYGILRIYYLLQPYYRQVSRTPQINDVYIIPSRKLSPWDDPDKAVVIDVKDGWVLVDIYRRNPEKHGIVCDPLSIAMGRARFRESMPIYKFLRQGWILKTTENEKETETDKKMDT